MKKCEACLKILSLLHSEFDKVNNTEAGILDSIYHMTSSLGLK